MNNMPKGDKSQKNIIPDNSRDTILSFCLIFFMSYSGLKEVYVMPGFNGRGPMGAGPMTGGARGFCNPAGAGQPRPFGRGMGLGRGFRGGYGSSMGMRRSFGRGFGLPK